MNRWTSSRRELLKTLGLGSACLPLLQATRPLRAAENPAPKRLVIAIQTNGWTVDMRGTLKTTTDLASTTLPPMLSPLEPFKKDLILLPDLANPEYVGAGHGAYGTTFSPGPNNPAPEYWTPAVPTLDQVCANVVAKTAKTALPSLPLQVQPDSSESRLGAYRCFFTGSDQAVTPETNPYKVSDRLFAGRMMGDPAVDKLRAQRKSMLDFVQADLQRFAKNLGREDKAAIAAHLQSIRDIELQLSAPTGGGSACAPPNLGQPLDLKSADNYPALLKLDLDLTLAALRCDSTRVVTLVLGNAFGGGVTFTWLGIPTAGLHYDVRNWHDVAHVEMRGTVNDKLAVDQFFMKQLAYLLDGLQKTPEGSGTMLDNTVVLWANHMETGGGHNAQKLPWILAGKGGGHFKTGQILHPSTQITKNSVMCEVANAMGANLPFFGTADNGSPLPVLQAG